MVGAAGFEPATPCTQSRCASLAAPRPDLAAAKDSAYVETRRIELEDIQERLRTFREKIDEQQQDTWNAFAREVDEYLDEVDDRIAQEWPATP